MKLPVVCRSIQSNVDRELVFFERDGKIFGCTTKGPVAGQYWEENGADPTGIEFFTNSKYWDTSEISEDELLLIIMSTDKPLRPF